MLLKNSGQLIMAEEDGVVEEAHAAKVVVAYGKVKKTYYPSRYLRSNEGSAINQRLL